MALLKRVLASLLVLVACASPPNREPQACAADTDCASDAHCRDEVCVADAAPQAWIEGPRSAAPNVEITFDGSGSTDADDDVVAYTWSIRVKSADCPPELHGSDGVALRVLFACPGEYDIILVVRDRTGVIGDPAIAPLTIAAP